MEAMDNQKTTSTKPVEITNPSPAQSSSRTVANERKEPAEEDMNTFFTGLKPKLSCYRIACTEQQAKVALDNIIKALNSNSGNFSPLEKEFMSLASFACSTTKLDFKQKDELLGLEERLKELDDQAAKAVQDKDQFTANDSKKGRITRKLVCNQIRYMAVESNLEYEKKNLADLREKVEAAQKKIEDMSAEQKKIFTNSKKLDKELDTLAKKCADYEGKAKHAVAEREKIKKFIFSIKGKI